MSWEASRWTAKTPSELFHTFGPHGVDELIRHGLAAVWRHLPEEGRTFDLARATARNLFDHHVRIWRKIKKPTPQDFFTDLGAHEADGYFRKAMVTAWMMMPRTGGREVTDCLRIVVAIFDRNIDAWAQDNATFTGQKQAKQQKKLKGAKAKEKPAKRATVAKSAGKSSTRPRASKAGRKGKTAKG